LSHTIGESSWTAYAEEWCRTGVLAMHPNQPLAAGVGEEGEVIVWDLRRIGFARTYDCVHLGGGQICIWPGLQLQSSVSQTTIVGAFTTVSHRQLLSNSALKSPSPSGKVGALFQLLFLCPVIVSDITKCLDGNWLVVVYEQHVALFDYLSPNLTTLHLPFAQLDIKAISLVEVVPSCSVLIIGGTDGQVRFWDTKRWCRLPLKLEAAHTKAITGMHFVMNEESNSVGLITSGEDGRIAYWVLPRSFRSDEPLSPAVSKKVHDGQIFSSHYHLASKSLITIGSDKFLSMWAITTEKEPTKIKVSQKGGWWAIRGFSHPAYPNHPLLICTKDDSKLFAGSLDGSTQEVLDLDSIPFLQRKGNKIQNFVVHLQLGHLVGCSHRNGVVFLSVSPMRTPQIVPLPRKKKIRKRKKDNPWEQYKEFIYSDGSALILHDTDNHSCVQKYNHATYTGTKPPTALLSAPNRRYVTMFWGEHSRYAIVDTVKWACVHEGLATAFAWLSDGAQDRFLVSELILLSTSLV
jgi:WD40 repeat protein